MRELREVLDEVHKRGAHIIETETGRRSDRASDAAMMVLDATLELKKGPPATVSKANGERSAGRPKNVDRLPDAEAKAIWISKDYATDAAAAKHMRGWSRGVAYHYFGPSGRRRTGRPRNPKSKR
jgi:hypothetical protein